MHIRYAAILAAVAMLLSLHAQTPRPAGADWPMYSRDLAGTRYSPLTQINTTNVANLNRAWSYRLQPETGNIDPGSASPSEIFQQVTPIVVNGVMYLPAGNRVLALEPETGKEIWRYHLSGGLASFRGVAYWPGDRDHNPRIFFTTSTKMVALNANTGMLDTRFGENGEIEMTVAYAGVPLVFRNMLFVGAMIFGPGERHLDAGTYPVGPPMNARAFDARTGDKIWEFNSIPQPGEFGNETWLDESWKDKFGPNIWAFTLTADEQRGIVYLPIGGPNNNYYGGNRPGDNLFANTLVAVNAETGERIWHFQTVHHELWDYDLPPPPVLFDLVIDGRTIPALSQTGKLGFMFILDRTNGEPVYDIVETPVPKGDVPGEWYSPTQPIPVKPPPLSRVSITRDDLVRPEDTTPEHAQACAELWDQHQYYNEGPYSPWKYRDGVNPPTLVFPGLTGGPNWGGSAYDPDMGYVFVNSKDAPVAGWVEENPNYSPENSQGQLPYRRAGGPAFLAPAVDETGQSYGNLPCFRPPWATLMAVDVRTGEFAWQVPLGVNANMPAGKQHVGVAGSGGPIVTAGGLLFIGATGNERRFRAFDSRTGAELWSAPVDNAITAVPMTYLGDDGKQYVAIVAASGAAGPSQALVVFALP